MVLVILGLIAYSTTSKAMPWFRKEGLGAIFSDNWDPAHNHFGALSLFYGTFLVGFLALLIAVPISIGIALFVTEIAPRRLARPVIYIVDLLAAIPSVVYGLWAIFVLFDPLVEPVRRRVVGDVGHPDPEDVVRAAQCHGPELHDRGDHRRDHDHADHHVDHA